MPGVIKPPLYVDNLKCSAESLRAVFGAARLISQCVLQSTSEAVKKSVKLCGGMPWKVKLDVRDLCGHLDFTWGARAGTLSRRVKDTHGVAAVGALPPGFQVVLGLIRGKQLPAGLHAVEASYVSASSLSAFLAAIVLDSLVL